MIIVYSKPSCPHCTYAKAYLDSLDIPYRTMDIQEDADAKSFVIGEGHRSVPQLYIGTTLLVEGGNDGLRALDVDVLKERIALLS